MSRVPSLRAAVFLAASLVLPGGSARAGNWPAWRGPGGQGVTTETNLPLTWSTTENVKWKIPLPAPGNSTPIVWGRQIFLTQATEGGKRRALVALERDGGKILWRREVEYGEKEPTHETNPYCSASPVTDGERVIVSHGSAGVFAYDLQGQELWRRDLGKFHHIWGNASSPVIAGDLCFLNCGPGERQSLLAVEKKTGKTVWQVEVGGREGGESSTWTGSWSTPLLTRFDAGEELLVSYPHRLRSFDPLNGKENWSCEGLGNLVYTSPIAGEGAVVALSGFGGPGFVARAGGRGDVTASHRLWRQDRAEQRIGSGVITGGHLYLVNDPGIAECIELVSGKRVWRERVASTCWSSLVLSEGRLYVPDHAGDCHVFRASPAGFERLAQNRLGELIRASLAVSDGELFIRTYQHLWCIRAAAPAAAGGR